MILDTQKILNIKFNQTLEAGLHFIIPFIDRIAYKHTLKEQAIDVTAQTAISSDNVSVLIDGVLYVKVIDPSAASYGVSNPYYAIIQLAQTTMRSEIGKLSLDKTFEERENLNTAIVTIIDEASRSWGMKCLRYEIKDIQPPQTVLQAMELQVAADRQKRAQILESEGKKQAKINHAEAEKTETVLSSEAAYIDKVNRAKGEAEAIIMVADATAKNITTIAQAIQQNGGTSAVSLKIAEQYLHAFAQLAKESNTIIVPANLQEPSSIITQALSLYTHLNQNKPFEK